MPNINIQRTAEVMLSERIVILAAADLGVRSRVSNISQA